jgi:hypothetical protein
MVLTKRTVVSWTATDPPRNGARSTVGAPVVGDHLRNTTDDRWLGTGGVHHSEIHFLAELT